MKMIVKVDAQNLKTLSTFLLVATAFAVLVYGAWAIYTTYFEPVTSWDYKGVTFSFRSDLRDAVKWLPLDDQVCGTIRSDFNSVHLQNVTLYVKNDEFDTALLTVEAVQFTSQLAPYYRADPPVPYEVGIKGATWNLEADPLGSPTHPRVYFIGPTSARELSVTFENYVLKIQGRSVAELDLATSRALMCVLGIELPMLPKIF